MKRTLRAWISITRDTFKEWKADDPFRQSAVIAYYAIFSLPALLVLIINFVGLFYEKDVISDEIFRQVKGVMGEETAAQISDIVGKAGEMKAGILAGIIAVLTMITGATGVFVELQKTLDHIWEVQQKKNLKFVQKLRERLFSFGLILAIGFLLLISLVVSTALAAFSHWIESVFPEGVAYLFYALDVIVSVSVITVLFALMFKFLPDIKIPFRHVWAGAFVTSVLFIIGKYALSIYFGKAEPASVYGAAGSIVLVLLWVSYSSMIVFFGAEFTHQYALYHHAGVKPAKIAERTLDAHGMEWEGSQSNSDKEIKSDETEAGSDGKMNRRPEQKKQKVHHDIQDQIDQRQHEEENDEEEKLHAESAKKFKSLKQVKEEIEKMNVRLEQDKEGIVDNLKPTHILASMVPKALRIRHELKEKLSMDSYLRHVAKRHISRKEESLMDRILRIMHMEDDEKPEK